MQEQERRMSNEELLQLLQAQTMVRLYRLGLYCVGYTAPEAAKKCECSLRGFRLSVEKVAYLRHDPRTWYGIMIIIWRRALAEQAMEIGKPGLDGNVRNRALNEISTGLRRLETLYSHMEMAGKTGGGPVSAPKTLPSSIWSAMKKHIEEKPHAGSVPKDQGVPAQAKQEEVPQENQEVGGTNLQQHGQ